MTGPQLNTWRTAHKLTLRDVADRLGSVTHTTISRWEASPESIPQWATDKLLGATEIPLPLTELHQLLDLARQEQVDFKDVLQLAIREYLAKHSASATEPKQLAPSPVKSGPTAPGAGSPSTIIPLPPQHLAAEDPGGYQTRNK